MKKYQVIGGEYETKWWGESDTLREAKMIANRFTECYSDGKPYKPYIYLAEDVENVESHGRILTDDGVCTRVPKNNALPYIWDRGNWRRSTRDDFPLIDCEEDYEGAFDWIYEDEED